MRNDLLPMGALPGRRTAALSLIVWAALSAAPQVGHAGGSDEITAVAAKTSPDYSRARQADGTYKTETYAFGNGGHYGGPMIDPSIDKLTFLDVAKVISVPLAEQNYWPDKDPGKTQLLVMVYWGLTDTPQQDSASVAVSNLSSIQNKIQQSAGLAKAKAASGGGKGFHSSNGNDGASDWQLDELSSAMTVLNLENQQRAHTDYMNAAMLGFDADGVIGTDYGNYIRGTPLGYRRDELVAEIEDHRYFVVLMAYDFQMAWKQKKHKLLWETRFSIRQTHNNFDRDLEGMARAASLYFGQNSDGLVRKPIPVGRVDIGAVQSLGTVPEK